MRILVIAQLPPFVTGGAEVQAGRLASEWQRRGHDVLVLGRFMRGRTVAFDDQVLKIRRIPMLDNLGRWLRGITYVLSLAWLLLRLRKWPDVLYCRFMAEAAVTACILKSLGLFPCPIVSVPASAGPDGDMGYLHTVPFHAVFLRLLRKHVAAINLIAPRMRSDLLPLGFAPERMHSIPNGIPILTTAAPISDGERQLITVCRLYRQKNLHVLLQALAPLIDQPFQLTIIGDGPLRGELEALAAKLGLQGRVEFAGQMDTRSIRERLRESHLFVLPSIYEGFSNSALEAMEAGLPVALSRCGGLDTYLDATTGWTFDADDVAGLSAILREALQMPTPALQMMGARCRQMVLERFDMRIVAQRNLDLFDQLRRSAPRAS